MCKKNELDNTLLLRAKEYLDAYDATDKLVCSTGDWSGGAYDLVASNETSALDKLREVVESLTSSCCCPGVPE